MSRSCSTSPTRAGRTARRPASARWATRCRPARSTPTRCRGAAMARRAASTGCCASLDRAGTRASVMVSGVFGERTPAAVRAIVAAGHETGRALLCAGHHPGAALARAGARRYRQDHRCAGGGRRTAAARLGQPARHPVRRQRALAGGGRLCVAGRRVRRRPSVSADVRRRHRHRRHSADDGGQRPAACHALRPFARTIRRAVRRGARPYAQGRGRGGDTRRHRAMRMSMAGRPAPGRSRRSPARSRRATTCS